MLTPRSRLLSWVALLVLPFAALGALAPEAVGFSLLMIGTFLAVTVLDAFWATGSLEGLRIELPKIARLSKDREGQVEVQVRNPSRKARRLRIGLPLPREIKSPIQDLRASLVGGTEFSKFIWPCLPGRRGNYPLDRCFLEASSPLGFWGWRKALPVQSELRVYPNLWPERKNVAALFLNRGRHGLHRQRFVGKGRDFEKLREYIPGDSYDEIHWKATARRGHPVTKVFQIERTQEVYVIIDASRLSARAPGIQPAPEDAAKPGGETEPSATVLERFVTSALVMAMAAEQQGDLFGLVTFSDKVHRFVRARNGKAHYNACRDALYTLHAQTVTPDFEELCSFIRLRLRRRALLVFLTALDDPVLSETFTRDIQLISRQHLVLVNMVQPPGVQPLFSGPRVAQLDDVYRELGGHLLWQNLRELEKILQRQNVRFSVLNNEKLCADLVSQYLSVKRRQLL